MTSFATTRVIGIVLLVSPLVLVISLYTRYSIVVARLAFRPSARASKGILHTSYFAAWIVCLLCASLDWMSRASPCRCVSFSCMSYVRRQSCMCLLTVRQGSHGCLSSARLTSFVQPLGQVRARAKVS